MTCNECRWKAERHECPWDFDYEDTDYAEDCIDFRSTYSPKTAFNRKEENQMTKEQLNELKNDHSVPWMTVISDELKELFTDEVAEDVEANILEAAWDRHLTLTRKDPHDEAYELLESDPNTNAFIILSVQGEHNAHHSINGSGKSIMALLLSGVANFIKSTAENAPEHLKDLKVKYTKAEFIHLLDAVLESKE